eukprot:TRINITY_DN1148_c0_g1_i2.p1 TRINITY_DN1148_c0_g1~~TRINITY_DN1148_c0_g1_i2.p1  ORF type:complete len:894 (+),score=144.29 TRINITY_DN1148_c0_g1_i2:2545-5226(+)
MTRPWVNVYLSVLRLIAANIGAGEICVTGSEGELECEIDRLLSLKELTDVQSIMRVNKFNPLPSTGQLGFCAAIEARRRQLAEFALAIQSIQRLKADFLRTIYIGIVGVRNAGKSTLAEALYPNFETMPRVDTKTMFPHRYEIKPGVFLVDFPGYPELNAELGVTTQLLMASMNALIVVLPCDGIGDVASNALMDIITHSCVNDDSGHLLVCLNQFDAAWGKLQARGISRKEAVADQARIAAKQFGLRDASCVQVSSFTNFLARSGSELTEDEQYAADLSDDGVLGVKHVRQWLDAAVATCEAERDIFHSASALTPSLIPKVTGLKILSLDGGGIRGIMTLYQLIGIQQLTKRKIWELFDVIVGTSTGALLAIALGIFKYDPRDLLDAYVTFSKDVFHGVGIFGYSEGKLEGWLRHFFGDAHIIQPTSAWPKVIAVSAVEGAHGYEPFLWRSYDPLPGTKCAQGTTQAAYSDARCWEAARASSAAPTFFKSYRDSRKLSHVDGGLVANNPAMVAVDEVVAAQLGPATGCVVISVGTGKYPKAVRIQRKNKGYTNPPADLVSVIVGVAKNVVDTATSTKQVHKALKKGVDSRVEHYLRFDPFSNGRIKLNDVRISSMRELALITARFMLKSPLFTSQLQILRLKGMLGLPDSTEPGTTMNSGEAAAEFTTFVDVLSGQMEGFSRSPVEPDQVTEIGGHDDACDAPPVGTYYVSEDFEVELHTEGQLSSPDNISYLETESSADRWAQIANVVNQHELFMWSTDSQQSLVDCVVECIEPRRRATVLKMLTSVLDERENIAEASWLPVSAAVLKEIAEAVDAVVVLICEGGIINADDSRFSLPPFNPQRKEVLVAYNHWETAAGLAFQVVHREPQPQAAPDLAEAPMPAVDPAVPTE